MAHERSVTRYVVTHVPSRGVMRGVRTLTFACQGRETYATREEAQKVLDEFAGPNGLARVLSRDEMKSLEVRACECWPVHFDPKGIYFE